VLPPNLQPESRALKHTTSGEALRNRFPNAQRFGGQNRRAAKATEWSQANEGPIARHGTHRKQNSWTPRAATPMKWASASVFVLGDGASIACSMASPNKRRKEKKPLEAAERISRACDGTWNSRRDYKWQSVPARSRGARPPPSTPSPFPGFPTGTDTTARPTQSTFGNGRV
jgi:hypothetical protein